MSKNRDFFKIVCNLAIPVALQSMLQASFSIVDQIMIGQLGSVSVAGVGLAGKFSSIYSFLMSSHNGIAEFSAIIFLYLVISPIYGEILTKLQNILRKAVYNLENFSCYPCTGLCICKSMVMVGQVISASRSYCLQLMVLKLAAEMASRSRKGVVKDIFWVVHPVASEHFSEASAIETGIVCDQRN